MWAVPSLERLIASDIEVACVVTNPDRPAGRGMNVRPSPVKERAQRAGLTVIQPPTARDPEFAERVRATGVDVAVVVAYGKLLPASLLAVPRLGFVNLHFSLLPAYRGAAPVQRAVIDGARTTGVSIMLLTEGMDEGPVLAQRAVAIEPHEPAGELGARLAVIGAELLIETLTAYVDGRIVPQEQDHDAATYAPKITDDEARIDWSEPAQRIHDLVRGCDPNPGAWTTLAGKRMKVFKATSVDRDLFAGEIAIDGEIVVGCGDGAVLLDEVQMEGKRRMPGWQVARGLRLGPGAYMENP